MFKNKGFLYGLGLGLILGACLLQLMNFAVLDNNTLTNGLQSASPSIPPTPSLEPVISVKPITTVKPVETANTPEIPSSSAIVTPVITKTEEPASPAPVATIVINEPTSTTVVIENGMTSSDVASLLFNKGIITDQEAFDNSLAELKLDRIIRIGSFTFLPNEKDADIINKITTRK